MITKVQKWGNSLGVRIPRSVAEEVRLEAGTRVAVRAENGLLVIVPTKKGAFDLSDLLDKITPDNLHGKISL